MFGKILCRSLFLFIVLVINSCAPVKFSKSNNVPLKPTLSIECTPRINATLTSFTYSDSTKPDIVSDCLPALDVTYEWTAKRADGTIVSNVYGLNGMNPLQVDFQSFGPGSYYVYLTATDNLNVKNPYVSVTPLEFIVPGGPLSQLVCDPKLNETLISVSVAANDVNPRVSSNCNVTAQNYTWNVFRNNVRVVIPMLIGAESNNPDFKSLGVGEYKVYLFATATGFTAWASTDPLVVNIIDTDPSGEILCNPRINGDQTNLTLTSSSPNPLISANCVPTDVQYSWTVVKNGQTISMPVLSGANSNPHFVSYGEGVYLVYLTASRSGYQSWTTTEPLILNVDGEPSPLTLNCSPRLNNEFVSMTIATNAANPNVTSRCNPETVNHSWTVVKNGQTIQLPDLNGSASTPNFTGQGEGTYLVYLTATSPGYNTYVSPSPLEIVVQNSDPIVRKVIFSKDVKLSDNKVDILLVVDDSNSMLPENQKLAQKLKGFVDDLSQSGLDWQFCATVTRAQNINGSAFWGASKNWVNYVGSPKWVLKLGATDPYAIFTNTINQIGAGWADTDDERAIKAAYSHVQYSNNNNCHRAEASLAVIILSDEDERSIGGNKAFQYYWSEWKTLEAEDSPSGFVAKVKQTLGQNKSLTVNSIIVKPEDAACMASQDASGAKSHYGYKYQELSQLTQGYTGSICDADYSQSLYYFKDKIKRSISSIPLDCAPVGEINVVLTPTMQGVTTQVVNNTLIFNPEIPAGRNIKVEYNCPVVR